MGLRESTPTETLHKQLSCRQRLIPASGASIPARRARKNGPSSLARRACVEANHRDPASIPGQRLADCEQHLNYLLTGRLGAGAVEELSPVEPDLRPRLALEATLRELDVRHRPGPATLLLQSLW